MCIYIYIYAYIYIYIYIYTGACETNTLFAQSLGHAVQRQKLLSSLCSGAFETKCPMGLLPEEYSFPKHRFNDLL